MKLDSHLRHTKTGSKVLDNGHLVTWTEESQTGYFNRSLGSVTTYNCSCGVRRKYDSRHLNANLANHDTWIEEMATAKLFMKNLLAS